MPLVDADMSMSFALSSLPVGGLIPPGVAPIEEVPAVTVEAAAPPTVEAAAPHKETAAKPPKGETTVEKEMISSSSAKSSAFAASLLGALILL